MPPQGPYRGIAPVLRVAAGAVVTTHAVVTAGPSPSVSEWKRTCKRAEPRAEVPGAQQKQGRQ